MKYPPGSVTQADLELLIENLRAMLRSLDRGTLDEATIRRVVKDGISKVHRALDPSRNPPQQNAQRPTLNLDVDAPDKVVAVLERAADQYRESAGELEAAWQDSDAGAPWIAIAQGLDGCAATLKKGLRRFGW